jgi:hypothetical protein
MAAAWRLQKAAADGGCMAAVDGVAEGGCRWWLHVGCMVAADGQMQMARCSRLPLARLY